MNSLFRLTLVVALSIVGSAWSQMGQAEPAHDAVAQARGARGQVSVVRQGQSGYAVARPAAPVPKVIAQRPSNSAARTFSYDPNAALTRPSAVPSVWAQPQRSGFHDAGAKVRGEFGK